MRTRYLYGGVALAAVFTVSCLLGVRSTPTVETLTGDFCPGRWASEDDPEIAASDEARLTIEEFIPDGATPLLPARALRLESGCPLELPIRIEEGKCYLFALQVFPRDGRPRATLRYPDPERDEPREFTLDHGMAVTRGDGADPICYEDSFNGVVELSVRGHGDMMWVQAWEFSPGAGSEWSAQRRAQLTQMHAQPEEEPEEVPPPDPRCLETDGGVPDGGVPDGGFPDGGGPDCGAADGGPTDGDVDPGWDGYPADGGVPLNCETDADVDGDMPDGGRCEPAPQLPPEPPPPPPIPEGPLAVELPEQCQDGEDNDQDGWRDCEDSDCAGLCPQDRIERTPWLRVMDIRLGGHYLINSESTNPDETFVPEFLELDGVGGGAGQASVVWRPQRYIGLGLDLSVGAQRLSSQNIVSTGSTYQQIKVNLLSASLGLSFHFSIPIWIMEIGGSLGLGWVHFRTGVQSQRLDATNAQWLDVPNFDGMTINRAYGNGTIWVDFWLRDDIALGVYGGVLASMDDEKGLPTNEYYVGLRTTLRLGL